jgi:stringent starvation protein A
MQLWSGTLSPFSAKVRMVCAEKGITPELRNIPWSRRTLWGPKPKELLAVSPRGQIPVLIDGDLTLFDSTVIDEYLEEKRPSPALLPRDTAARARVRLLEDQADYMITTHATVLIREVFLKPDGNGRDGAAVDGAMTAYAGYYALLDGALAGGDEYLCGEFSLADIASFLAVSYGAILGAPVPAERARVAAWHARVGARPAIKQEFDAIMAAVAQV